MSIYNGGNRGTIRSTADYNAQQACVKLYEAMKGLGTDEGAVIDVIAAHTAEERQSIKKKYMIQYSKDLVKELDGELSFSFGKLVLALLVDPEEFLLECIHHAASPASRSGKLFKRLSSLFKEGLGGNEYLLIGILCGKSKKELKNIKKVYKKRFGEKLDEKIAGGGNNMSQDVCSFILDMISGDREEHDEEDEVDLEILQEDLEELNAAKSEEVLHGILQERSFIHLRRFFDECKQVNGKEIGEYIDEFEGITPELKAAYMAMITLVREGEAAYYAERVKGAIEGAGTDDDTLIKVIVMRAEIDLIDIIESYEAKYNVSMADEVANDCSGDYNVLLQRILTIPPPLPADTDEKVEGRGEGKIQEGKKVVKREEPLPLKKEAIAKEKEIATKVEGRGRGKGKMQEGKKVVKREEPQPQQEEAIAKEEEIVAELVPEIEESPTVDETPVVEEATVESAEESEINLDEVVEAEVIEPDVKKEVDVEQETVPEEASNVEEKEELENEEDDTTLNAEDEAKEAVATDDADTADDGVNEEETKDEEGDDQPTEEEKPEPDEDKPEENVPATEENENVEEGEEETDESNETVDTANTKTGKQEDGVEVSAGLDQTGSPILREL